MTSELVLEVLKSGIGLFFALLQFLLIGAIAAGFNMWVKQRDMAKDLDSAFDKIRELQGLPPRNKKEN